MKIYITNSRDSLIYLFALVLIFCLKKALAQLHTL